MNETMKPSCGEAYDATPVAVLAASETLTIAHAARQAACDDCRDR